MEATLVVISGTWTIKARPAHQKDEKRFKKQLKPNKLLSRIQNTTTIKMIIFYKPGKRKKLRQLPRGSGTSGTTLPVTNVVASEAAVEGIALGSGAAISWCGTPLP